jgi:hypothetical protein
LCVEFGNLNVFVLQVTPLANTSIKEGAARKAAGKLVRRKGGYKQSLQRRALEKKKKSSLLRRLSNKRQTHEIGGVGGGGVTTVVGTSNQKQMFIPRSISTSEGVTGLHLPPPACSSGTSSSLHAPQTMLKRRSDVGLQQPHVQQHHHLHHTLSVNDTATSTAQQPAADLSTATQASAAKSSMDGDVGTPAPATVENETVVKSNTAAPAPISQQGLRMTTSETVSKISPTDEALDDLTPSVATNSRPSTLQGLKNKFDTKLASFRLTSSTSSTAAAATARIKAATGTGVSTIAMPVSPLARDRPIPNIPDCFPVVQTPPVSVVADTRSKQMSPSAVVGSPASSSTPNTSAAVQPPKKQALLKTRALSKDKGDKAKSMEPTS